MRFIKTTICLLLALTGSKEIFAQKDLAISIEQSNPPIGSKDFYKADNALIQYYGRIEKLNPTLPRFWAPGVYIKAKFDGNTCSFFVNDQVLYGNVHNYIEIVIDGKPFRIQTKFVSNKISIKGLKKGAHTITICKDTESGNGYLEFAGIQCKKILQLPPKPSEKIEFIGNSITCGYGADIAEIPCGKGQWYDEHNAYMSYGPLTARALNAQWHITAVSGIGMIHSCCNMKITMPQVFDKVDQRDDSILWNFNDYIPDLVTICLGQNDGIQDSTIFCNAYVDFIKTIRHKYENAKIILLTSPMADAALTKVLKNYLTSINDFLDEKEYKNIVTIQVNQNVDNLAKQDGKG
ncbi:MAG TPA: SGNH/GDSL hydrolase family protein [Hanamia sp.]|nr:SGNH/GDSL hydrolase family protein [Hanamia sp.]